GAKGVGAASLMRQLSLTSQPSVVENYASIAQKLGVMNKSEFKDSFNWLRQTGFDVVSKEHAWRDDVFHDKPFSGSGVGSFFLDKGPMFFNGTERFIRVSSWNAAYIEYLKQT